MNMFVREMKAGRKSMVLWVLGIIAMVGGGMSEYSSMSSSGDSMSALLNDMPKALQAIMGVGDLDVSTVIGYYGMIYLYLVIMAAIHASMLGAGIVSKEERDGTMEFLLAKPISRSALLSSKLIAAAVQVVIFNVVMRVVSLSVVVAMAGSGGGVIGDLSKLMLGMLLVQLLFLSVGAAIAATIARPRRAVGIAAGIMLFTLLLSMAIDISGKMSYLSYLSPFQYFTASGVIHDGFRSVYVALALLITVVSIVAAFVGFKRRDLRV